ncbi:12647_t:CDS:1 [Cetraspora pellucida]|uniref:12647_t:CDS:1 n=1 Tax=Cetraspora pellucida TaxID=1433469 RepID=A0A9N9D8E2_9GLOM|nr:12647_t:CDS:1 [Cetraspora pellucida]
MEDLTESPNDFVSSNSTQNNINNTNSEVVSSSYSTKDHWEIVLHNNQRVWQCLHCKTKVYSINTSRTHFKNHTLTCPSTLASLIQDKTFKQITKEDVDNLIVDLVIGTGMSFNILNNPLFHNMARKLYFVTSTYKVPHPTTVSRHLTGNIFNKRFEFIKNILNKCLGKISITCDGWHSTVHKCHYVVITGSWISDEWQIVNIVLSFQKSGQTAKEIISTILNTLENYSIKNKIFALT